MPTYNYKCSKCGNVFDVEATLQEKEEGGKKFVCSKCGANEIKQNFSAVNFMKNIFSGGSSDGCCSGGDVCDVNCKPNDNNLDSCDDKKDGSSCCG